MINNYKRPLGYFVDICPQSTPEVDLTAQTTPEVDLTLAEVDLTERSI